MSVLAFSFIKAIMLCDISTSLGVLELLKNCMSLSIL